MIGFGFQPFGFSTESPSYAGYGQPEPLPSEPVPGVGGLFLDTAGHTLIDPETGDLARMGETEHRVMLALRTEIGSSSARPNFGLKRPKVIGDKFDGEIKVAVRAALSHLLREQVIEILEIAWSQSREYSGRVLLSVTYRDSLTGQTVQQETLV